MASDAVLEIESRENVRVLRLNRPERKNALSSELGWAIVSALEEAAGSRAALDAMDLDAMEELWQQVKRQMRAEAKGE